jgi:hypothetical protein
MVFPSSLAASSGKTVETAPTVSLPIRTQNTKTPLAARRAACPYPLQGGGEATDHRIAYFFPVFPLVSYSHGHAIAPEPSPQRSTRAGTSLCWSGEIHLNLLDSFSLVTSTNFSCIVLGFQILALLCSEDSNRNVFFLGINGYSVHPVFMRMCMLPPGVQSTDS